MKTVPSSGFFSYRQLDNKNDQNYLTRLRQNLEQEIGTLIGRPMTVWQDVDEIEWGQHWKAEIGKGLAEAAFFIPVITPGYLQSEECRREFMAFLEYEKRRSRNDLILPLIYVRPDEFDDPEAKSKDKVLQTIVERQYANWEPLRHVGDERIEYRQQLTSLGKRVRALLKSIATPAKSKKSGKKKHAKSGPSSAKPKIPSSAASTTPAILKQRTLLVNRLGGTGIYQSIGEAITAAQGGDLITVAPGHYRERVLLNKPVEIFGEGNPGDVTVEMNESMVMVCTTTFGRVRNMTFRQDGGAFLAINVAAGSVEFEGCEVTSAGYSCIGIQKGADCRIRNCKIHGSPHAGIAFFAEARGLVEQCDIYRNGYAGIHIRGCVDVIIRRNSIHDGKQQGLVFIENATGLTEDNDIFANRFAGISIQSEANPTIRLNRVFDGLDVGIGVYDSGLGLITDNEVFRNTFSGILLSQNNNSVVASNDVHDGLHNGIYLLNAKGKIENNRVLGNKFNGILLVKSTGIEARKNVVKTNGWYGVRIDRESDGVFEYNELSANVKGAKDIAPEVQGKVKWDNNTET